MLKFSPDTDCAVPLSDAWFHFASKEKQNLFRDADSETERQEIERQLQRDLDLCSDQYFVIGVERDPFFENDLEIIPKVILFSRPRIDWKLETISARGQTYDLVRVLERKDVESAPDETLLVPPLAHQANHDGMVSSAPENISSSSEAKPLETRSYAFAKPVIDALIEKNPIWMSLPAESAIDEFNAEFARQHRKHAKAKFGYTARRLRAFRNEYNSDRKFPEISGS